MAGVYPLRGIVDKAKHHYYASDSKDFSFPPKGCPMFEVGYHSSPFEESTVGVCTRPNSDIALLAWGLRLMELQAAGNAEDLESFKEAGNAVTMRFTCHETKLKQIGLSYQIRENEEVNAEIMGHTAFMRVKELVSIQDCFGFMSLLRVLGMAMSRGQTHVGWSRRGCLTSQQSDMLQQCSVAVQPG